LPKDWFHDKNRAILWPQSQNGCSNLLHHPIK